MANKENGSIDFPSYNEMVTKAFSFIIHYMTNVSFNWIAIEYNVYLKTLIKLKRIVRFYTFFFQKKS